MHRTFVAGLLALAIAGPASAQTMQFACPEPGTKITYDSKVVVISRGQDGMDCKMDTVGGSPFKVRGLLIANPSADGGDVTAFVNAIRPERLWPLEVGKKIEAEYKANGKGWTYILSVASHQKFTGPDGAQVDCFVVEMNEQGPDGFRSVTRWRISPLEKYWIQYDTSNSAGKASRAVVTSFSH